VHPARSRPQREGACVCVRARTGPSCGWSTPHGLVRNAKVRVRACVHCTPTAGGAPSTVSSATRRCVRVRLRAPYSPYAPNMLFVGVGMRPVCVCAREGAGCVLFSFFGGADMNL
jgi:hypothetical protein